MVTLPAAVVFCTHWTSPRIVLDFRPGGDAMSKMIEFSDSDYAEIHEAASAAGMTPDEWIVARLIATRSPYRAPEEDANDSAGTPGPIAAPAQTMAERLAGRLGRIGSGTGKPSSDGVTNAETAEAPCTDTEPARTMADRFAGRVGLFDSGGDGRLSESTGEQFTDYLVDKQRSGRL
jgi:hypothetical protein